MGCRLSVTRGRNRPKPRPSRRAHGPEELHFLDEFGQPITVQLEERGRGQYRPMGAPWEMAQTPCYTDPYMAPNLYPFIPHEQFPNNGCVPSVSYSLDHMDHMEQVDPEWLQAQFSSAWPPPDLRQDSALDLDQVQAGPGLVQDFPCSSSQLHRAMLSEAETDIVSSLPGHTPSSRGSSDSLTSSLTSEPSDSGFHSVSTAGPAPRAVGPSPGHTHHRPYQQRGRWELQSIPENWSPSHHHAHQQSDQRGFWEIQSIPESGARARCSVGNSTTTTVHFHRAERSPTSPRQHSPRLLQQHSPATTPLGCRTEPCHRRALWLQDGSRTLTEPNRSQTFTDLSQSQNQHRRRASHPCTLQMSDTRTQPSPAETRPNQTSTAPRRSHSRTSQWERSLTHDRETSLSQDQNQDLNQFSVNPSIPSTQALRSRSRESLDQVYAKPNRARTERELSLEQNPHSPLTRTSQTLKTRSNREPPAQFYSTVQSSPRSPSSTTHNHSSSQRHLRRHHHRVPRLVRQRSDVTTDEELFPPPQDRRRGPGHKIRVRSSQSRTGTDQDPLMLLREQNLDRIRTRQILDEWTTVEELLSHGTRTETRTKGWPSPLLSVTTV